ncbi:MAG: hypothetical protein HND27_08065 [Bacteroidetes bacterium]|nr:hypothetical protein [Bacteroidota bacterium]MBV6461630.1 hypothetical protein [Flavobacteriales bacterium]WKZ74108.1 MAG: hypothetical protein QY303_08105 [Vicingaceae bacterium]MCL4816781.1 hypothetical protein [Flavobacteriales bacterium]NOG95719.1 hypothetical protein [Bacteroidota bacterium]
MKKLLFIFLLALCTSEYSVAQLTYQHDVYFENHSSLLSDNNKKTIEQIYKKIPGNATQKINPLGKNEFKGNKFLTEINYTRAWNIMQFLKTIMSSNTSLFVDTFINQNSGTPFYGVLIKKAPIELEPNYSELKKLYRKNKRTFYINPTQNETITGIEGTVITFFANTMQCNDGKDVKGTVEISLTEYYTMADMVKAQLNTVSGPLLLESGGMILIKATCSSCREKEVKIKDGDFYKIAFPTEKIKPGMGLFTGNIDVNKNLIDWQAAEFIEDEIDLFESESTNEEDYILSEDPETGELIEVIRTKEEKQLYHTLNSKSFGWINCDRFIDTPIPSALASTVHSPVKQNHVVLVFNQLKSVLELYPDENGNYSAQNLPYGEKATLFSYSIANGKTYFGKKEITIGIQHSVEIHLEENPFESFQHFLSTL